MVGARAVIGAKSSWSSTPVRRFGSLNRGADLFHQFLLTPKHPILPDLRRRVRNQVVDLPRHLSEGGTHLADKTEQEHMRRTRDLLGLDAPEFLAARHRDSAFEPQEVLAEH